MKGVDVKITPQLHAELKGTAVAQKQTLGKYADKCESGFLKGYQNKTRILDTRIY